MPDLPLSCWLVALWNQVQSQGHPHWCLLCASASEMVTEIETALPLFFRNILTKLYISEMILNDIRLIHKRKEFETTDAYLHMKEVIWLGIYPTHAYIGTRWFTLWRCLLFSTGFRESREISWDLVISFLATKCWMKRILMSVSFFFLSPKRQPYNKIFFFPASSYFAHLQQCIGTIFHAALLLNLSESILYLEQKTSLIKSLWVKHRMLQSSAISFIYHSSLNDVDENLGKNTLE